MGLTDSFIHSLIICFPDNLQPPRRRLYEIRQPPTSLCTTCHFFRVAMVIMVATVIVVMVVIAVMMVMLVMLIMVVVVNMVVMLVRTGKERKGEEKKGKEGTGRHLNLTLQVTCGWQLSVSFCTFCLFYRNSQK